MKLQMITRPWGPTMMRKVRPVALVVATALGLSACGSGGGSNTSTQEQDTETFLTNFTLNVSDAPVDNASEVVVYFDSVELIGNGDPITFDVRDDSGLPRSIDLLKLQGTAFASLVTDEQIPAGEYTQLRLHVTDDSYITMDDGVFPLEVPSNEVKLDGFTALANTSQAFTVEFDLRKSLVDPQGQDAVFLKPRGVRLVDNNQAGGIEGSVTESLLSSTVCAVKSDFSNGNAVYVYEGTGLSVDALGDDADDDNEIRPIATGTVVSSTSADTHTYSIGYLAAGDYTVAVTCLAHLDEPETDEDEGFSFLTVKEVSVAANEVTTVNFGN